MVPDTVGAQPPERSTMSNLKVSVLPVGPDWVVAPLGWISQPMIASAFELQPSPDKADTSSSALRR